MRALPVALLETDSRVAADPVELLVVDVERVADRRGRADRKSTGRLVPKFSQKALVLLPSTRSSLRRQVGSPRPRPYRWLLGKLVQLREQLVISDELLGTIEDLLVANGSLLIDDRVRPLGVAVEPALRIGVQKAIGLEGGARKIADQREGEPHLLAPCLKGRHEVGAHAHDLGIAAFELGKVKLESRDLAGSSRGEGGDDADQYDVLLSLVVGQRQALLRGRRRRQREVWCLVADPERCRYPDRAKHKRDRDQRRPQTSHQVPPSKIIDSLLNQRLDKLERFFPVPRARADRAAHDRPLAVPHHGDREPADAVLPGHRHLWIEKRADFVAMLLEIGLDVL